MLICLRFDAWKKVFKTLGKHRPIRIWNLNTVSRIRRLKRLKMAANGLLSVLATCLVLGWPTHVDPSYAQSVGENSMAGSVQENEQGTSPDAGLEELIQGFEEKPPTHNSPPADGDTLLKGFDDEPMEETRPQSTPTAPESSLSITGELSLTSIINVSADAVRPWRGVTMLRPELELTLEKRFSDKWQGKISTRSFFDAIYELRGGDEFTSQVRNEYEEEFEFEDVYIQGRLTDQLDTKIGRQIVVWGAFDNIRVTDLLNPLDQRVPGLTDIDDLRLPVTMAKFDYYFGQWALSAMAIPEVRFSKLPVFGSDFYSFPEPPPSEETPDDGFKNMQYAAALTGVFSGWDVGFYWANTYADQTYTVPSESGSTDRFIRKHPRINMVGAAANLAMGNWLLKAEAAWLDRLRYTNSPGIKYNRLDLGGGIEYSGFSEATISLEVVNRYIIDYRQRLKEPPDSVRRHQLQWAVRLAKDFINDTLTVTVLAVGVGITANDGAFQRLDAEYDINDAVSVRGGVVLYQSGERGQFTDIDNNDRLFLILAYNF